MWYAIFRWPIVGYPDYAKGPCLSPNHAYYVTKHQSFWQSLFISAPDDFGTVRLFDRSGNLLYEDETFISEEFGPEWSAGVEGGPRHPPVVFYQGIDAPGWMFTLPTSPGHGQLNMNCYAMQIE